MPTREELISQAQKKWEREQLLSQAKAKWESEGSAKEPKTEARGVKVYDQPAGPEQESAVDRFAERVKDPKRWQAILVGDSNVGGLVKPSPYAKEVVQGDAPMALPGGAIPKLTKAATALAEGKSIGHALGRVALSTAQGAGMSALNGEEGESVKDKLDRIEHGAKLSGGIQLAAESLPYLGKLAGAVARKVGKAGTNISEDIIKNYAERTDEVNDLIKQSGGDMTAAADQVRTELSSGIQNTKKALNSQITKTLESATPEANISAKPIIDRLEAAKAKLNPNYKKAAIADIDEMISNVKAQAKDGMLDARGLYETKQYLGAESSGAYNKGGQIFTRASEAARAAKEAAGEAREAIKTYTPDIAKADAQLSRMHAIEFRLNKNLLAPGKPDAALMAAGAGANPRNTANLRALEEISGVPVTQRAKDLATAKEFANPSLLPTDTTGKAVGRMLLGAGLGGAASSQMDGDAQTGAMVGGALASPMLMKLGINATNVAKTAAGRLPNFAEMIRKNPVAAQAIVQLVGGQIRSANTDKPVDVSPDVEDYFQKNPKLLENVQDPKMRAEIARRISRKPADLKGEDRWASQGAEKLGLDGTTAQKLMQNKEAKRLLIEASNLPADSKALKRIKDQVQKGLSK